jgi:tetratricopeptide (TPR) repeat protein
MMRKALNLLITMLIFSSSMYAQGNKKALADAERYFGIKVYDQALPLYLEAIQAGEKDPMVHYRAGICYQKTGETNEIIKAIPFFEYAAQNGTGLPNSIHYDLGEIYLLDENFVKALESFTKFKELAKADKAAIAKAEKEGHCYNKYRYSPDVSSPQYQGVQFRRRDNQHKIHRV